MAAYEFLGAEPTIQTLSSDIVRDAQRITGRASESQIVFSLTFAPYPTDPQGTVIWTDSAIDQQMSYWAGVWDTNAKVKGVLGVGLSQAVNPLGVLEDIAVVVVSSTSGNSTTNLTLYPFGFLPENFKPAVGTAKAQLDAVEAAGSVAPAP